MSNRHCYAVAGSAIVFFSCIRNGYSIISDLFRRGSAIAETISRPGQGSLMADVFSKKKRSQIIAAVKSAGNEVTENSLRYVFAAIMRRVLN